MKTRSLRNRLNRIFSWDDFFVVRQALTSGSSREAYDALFPLALSGRDGNAPRLAGCLLIEVQPDCPESLPVLMAKIHASQWFVSFREVPFYLVTQFGKHAVVEAATRFTAGLPEPQVSRSRVAAVEYWVRMPASELRSSYHDWEHEALVSAPWRSGNRISAATLPLRHAPDYV